MNLSSTLQILDDSSLRSWAADFSPDGKQLASGLGDNTVQIWDVAVGTILQTCEGHSNFVDAVAFSPDGKQLASGSHDCTLQIWDVATGANVKVLIGHSGWVRAVAFSPNGKQLASGSEDETIQTWNVATGLKLRTLRGHSNRVGAVAFSSNGKWLASGSADKTLRVWDATTGATLQTLNSHSGSVDAVAFSPNSKQLASGSEDTTVCIWDTATGAKIRTLKGHSDWVRTVAFSPDSNRLVSTSEDKTMCVWYAVTGERLEILKDYAKISTVSFSGDRMYFVTESGSVNAIPLYSNAVASSSSLPPSKEPTLMSRSPASNHLFHQQRTKHSLLGSQSLETPIASKSRPNHHSFLHEAQQVLNITDMAASIATTSSTDVANTVISGLTFITTAAIGATSIQIAKKSGAAASKSADAAVDAALSSRKSAQLAEQSYKLARDEASSRKEREDREREDCEREDRERKEKDRERKKREDRERREREDHERREREDRERREREDQERKERIGHSNIFTPAKAPAVLPVFPPVPTISPLERACSETKSPKKFQSNGNIKIPGFKAKSGENFMINSNRLKARAQKDDELDGKLHMLLNKHYDFNGRKT
jgi:WD40 repeat protein